MNLALFVTKESLATLPAIVAEMTAKQQETVNGACVVLHDSNIKPADLAFCLPLARRFKVGVSLPVQLNSSHSTTAQNAALFSHLLTGAYTRYPGPWLVFDEPASPKVENFMQEALKQHGQYGGRMTGRATTHPGSVVPIGPVTLNLDFKLMRFLRYPTKQSWRERGQFLFTRAGFQLVPAEEWLFTMSRSEIQSAQARTLGGMAVEATQLDPGFLESITVNDFDNQSNANLARFIEKVTGSKPHHFTGRDKLLSMARELSLTPA